MSKFTVLYLSFYFVVYLLKLKLNLFYNKVVYYYTRIFLILLQHPVYLSKYLLCEKSVRWLLRLVYRFILKLNIIQKIEYEITLPGRFNIKTATFDINRLFIYK